MPGAARTVTVAVLGDTANLERAFVRAGLVVEDTSKKIQGSAATAGRAAAEQAKAMGASATEQEAAAARAAAAFTEASAKISASQKAAGEAAASAARTMGAALDEQRAAYSRAIASQGEYEAATARASKASQDAAAHSKKLNDSLVGVGKWTAAGLAVGTFAAVKLGAAFQSAAASIQGATGQSTAAVGQITSAFGGLGGKFEYSGQQMESAFAGVSGQLKVAEGAALNAAQSVRVMTAAGNLAEGTQSDLATTTAALAQTMQAYHLSVSQAASASDVLFSVSKSLNVPVDAVSQSMGRLHARLGELAPSMHDVGGLMIALAEHGLTGSKGLLAVNSALTTMTGGSKATAAVLKALGVSVFDASGHFIGMQNVIAQLQPKFAGMTEQQRLFAEKALFGSAAAKTLGAVIQGGVPAYNAATAAASKLGTAHAAAVAQAKTAHGAYETLKGVIETLAGDFGNFLTPRLRDVSSALSTGIQWLQKHKAAAEALGAVITGVLGVAVTVFAYTKAVAFVKATRDMVREISKVAGAVASAASSIGAKLAGIVTSTTAADTAIEGENAAAGTSFAGVATEAGVAGATLDGEWGGAAAGVEGANTAMEASNTALGASFAGVLAALTPLLAAYAAYKAFTGTGGLNAAPGETGPTSTHGRYTLNRGQQIFYDALNPAQKGFANAGLGEGAAPQNVFNSLTGSGGSANWKIVAGNLAAQGFSKTTIAGILGNFAQETGGGSLSSINTADSGTGASGMGGMGIANWTEGRRTAEMAYAKSQGENPTSLVAQVGYLVQELRTNYHNAYKQTASASSPAAAAAIFSKLFEGGSDPGGVRERAAQQAYQLLGGTSGSGSGSGSGNPAVQRLLNSIAAGKTTKSKSVAVKAVKAVKTLLYANPLEGDQYSVERTDQGKDFGSIHGNIGAIGAGVITLAQSLQGFGQTIVEKLTSGPNKGKEVYLGMETGAAGVGLHTGQSVRAGQAIARGLGTGGVEMGFWNPATGRSEGAPYFTGSNATPPGTAFANWMAQLSHGNTYTSTKGGVTTGGGSNLAYQIATAEQAFITALQKAANALIQTYTNLEQSGTVKTLSKALGVSTSGTMVAWAGGGGGHGPIGTPPHKIHESVAGVLRTAVEGLKTAPILKALDAGKSPHALDKALIPLLNRASASSGQEKAYTREVAELRATGQKALADRLVAAHGAAMATLAQEIYAEQKLKDAELTQLQSTHLKDQTTLMQNQNADLLNIAKAQQTRTDDAAQSQVTYIHDMTQYVTDRFSGIVQAIQESATAMADASSAVVTGIQDQTAIKVDILGERGLYGLNLIAQKEQVQLDIMKQGFDQQVAGAQQNLDQVTALTHAAETSAQLNLDQVTTQQDQLVALSLANDDAVKVQAAIKVAAAQARLDALTLHLDTSLVGPAQMAVDLGATLPKAQQDVLNSTLKNATASASLQENKAGKVLADVTDAMNKAVQTADTSLTGAQDTASNMIATAQGVIAAATGAGNAAIAQAQASLQGVQGTAAQAEAGAQAGIDITKEQASTQYAGSGLVVNVYGSNLSDPATTATEVGWILRTQVPR